MATPVTLAQLVLRVRRRCNLEGNSVLQLFPDEELIDNINDEIGAWWDMVRLTTFMGQYARAPFPFSTVALQSLYPLPANCASLISVDANINGQSYAISAMPYQEEQRNMFKLLPFVGWSFGIQSVWYQLQGTNINFLPTPDAGYNITINYVPTAPVLSAPGDVLNSFNNWEEWIVLGASIKCLLKIGQEDLIAILQGMQDRQTDRILNAAAEADMNASEGVHETMAYGNLGMGGQGGYGGW